MVNISRTFFEVGQSTIRKSNIQNYSRTSYCFKFPPSFAPQLFWTLKIASWLIVPWDLLFNLLSLFKFSFELVFLFSSCVGCVVDGTYLKHSLSLDTQKIYMFRFYGMHNAWLVHTWLCRLWEELWGCKHNWKLVNYLSWPGWVKINMK